MTRQAVHTSGRACELEATWAKGDDVDTVARARLGPEVVSLIGTKVCLAVVLDPLRRVHLGNIAALVLKHEVRRSLDVHVTKTPAADFDEPVTAAWYASVDLD